MQAHPRHQRKLFLDKFQGKRKAITKQGLLHLLQNQLEAVNKNRTVDQERKRKLQKNIVSQQKKYKEVVSSLTESILEKKQLFKKVSRSSELQPDRRYSQKQGLKELKSQQLLNKVKLPSISKSSSLSIQRKIDIPNAQHPQSTPASKDHSQTKSLSNKNKHRYEPSLEEFPIKIGLDSYALKHLQFLEKFEKQIMKNESISKRIAKSELK